MLDLSTFPIVSVNAGASDHDAAEHDLDLLLQRGERFVFITTPPASDRERNLSSHDRKRRAAWIKANRKAFSAFCAAVIVVDPNGARNPAVALAARIAGAAFGAPLETAATLEHAHEKARRILALGAADGDLHAGQR